MTNSKPPEYLTTEEPALSIEDLEDLQSILDFVKEKGWWDYLKNNISSVEVDLDKLLGFRWVDEK